MTNYQWRAPFVGLAESAADAFLAAGQTHGVSYT